MAIFHFPVSIVSRGKGQSAVAKAAYNAREKLENEKTGELHDYTRAEGLAFSGIFAPKDAPDWVQDREKLWSEVERVENRKNSQLARSIEIGLPHELTEEQRRQLVTDFVRENFVRHGMIADVAIHRPDRDGDERNHHAHVLLTMREIGPDGFGAKRREWNSKEQLETWRENWARTANRYLERHGHEARIDHRSLEAQGIDREPTQHLGPKATQLERSGEQSERGDINRDIEARNRERERLQIEARAVGRELTEVEQTAPASKVWTIEEMERARRVVGYDVLRKAEEAEKFRQNRNAINEDNRSKIREAAKQAEGGIDFMIQLQEKELQLATDKYGRFVAVAPSGYEYALGKMVGPELLKDLGAKRAEGLILQTAEQVRNEQKQARETKRLEWEKKQEEATKRTVHRGATLYERGDMASQQRDALRHHKDHLKAQEKHAKEKAKDESFAGRKEQGQQKREEKNARTEQTETMRRHAQSEAVRERFEMRFGKGHNAKDRENWERERERER